jgi:NAD(P)H dehydrogenase (quinone)
MLIPKHFLLRKSMEHPLGAVTYAGPDGSRQPTLMELSIAENHGKHFAKLTAKISA